MPPTSRPARLKTARVLVTPTSFGKNDVTLRMALELEVGEVVYNQSGKPLTSGELAGLIGGFDGFIAGLDTIDRAALDCADRLKVIARYGVGVDAVDLQAAREKGIIVTNTPGANSVSVAELAVGLMLSLARNIPAAANATRSGEWPRTQGISLKGKTIGLIGFGSIGKQVARMLRGFDCTLLAYDPIADETTAAVLNVQLVDIDEVASQADFLSLHCPVLPETRGMLNANFINQMKAGSFLVNTARGELVVETDLLAALESGHLRGAALDVFAPQPPDPSNPLLSHYRVIATPHMGAHTDGAMSAMGWMALNDCLAVLRGEEPLYRVV
jgi:D-3-phosphoglycerate dehydrogenase